MLTPKLAVLPKMKRFEVECRTCGSTYDIGSDGATNLSKGSISCFVCNEKIFAYNGFLAYYPFLKQRKEKHIKFDPDLQLDDSEPFDRERNA